MNIDFEKFADGLVPAVVQDSTTGGVLMVGFMNADALSTTIETDRVTFYSRSRKCLWTKGETSGNYLSVEEIFPDCDRDTILIKAKPAGVVCHTGAETCFSESNVSSAFLVQLEALIADRRSSPQAGSYTSDLFAAGLNRIAQKVGEEAIETVIAAKDGDREAFVSEAADLVYHLLVLLAVKNVRLDEVIEVLRERKRKASE